MLDMTGERFGRLTVLRLAGNDRWGNRLWLCACSCGRQKVVPRGSLRRSLVRSCGCLKRDLEIERGKLAARDLAGKRFGEWTVIGRSRKRIGRANYRWTCRCSCGAERDVVDSTLLNGQSNSCGCMWRELIYKAVTRHGFSAGGRTKPTYNSWAGMLQRCLNPLCPAYKDYGGRGITVCQRWQNSFMNFLADMKECPTGLSIERINNDGNYEPGNCKWATCKEQSNNRRERKDSKRKRRQVLGVEVTVV